MSYGSTIRNQQNIHVEGDFNPVNLSNLLHHIHQATEKAGFEEVVLDFSNCTSAFGSTMLALCAQAIEKRKRNIYLKLELPEKKDLSRLFVNANWANFIDPRRYDEGNQKSYVTRIPATQYKNSGEQHSIVNKIVNVMLGMIPELERSDFSAFEWSINEITDNVLTHSESSDGGLVQLSFMKNKKRVQYMVADAGIGVPNSMRSGKYEGIKDINALEMAIREGVTRDTSIGQGNGLFGSYQISQHCHGSFHIRSGHASLFFSGKNGLKISNEKIPYEGTLVAAEIDFSTPGLLGEALKFGGKKHIASTNFVESEYKTNEDGAFLFKLKNEAESFGSRPAGKPVRNKLQNLFNMGNNQKIQIDFDGVPIMSSSFADEAFAKLFLEVGPTNFMQKIEFINILQTCQNLIDRAITQRIKAD